MLANRKAIYEQFNEDKEAMKQQKYAMPADYKKEFEWLKEVDSLAQANAQMNLQTAYLNFFRDKSIGFPKLKSKHHDRKSYTTNNQKGSIRLVNDTTIRLPKLKDVRIKLHRAIPEQVIIKSATISQTSTGAYYISILVVFAKKEQIPPTITPDTVLGLDYSSLSLWKGRDQYQERRMSHTRHSLESNKNRWANGVSLVIILTVVGTSQEAPTS